MVFAAASAIVGLEEAQPISTRAQPLPHRLHMRRRTVVLAGVVLLLAAAGIAVAVDPFQSSQRTETARPGLQRLVDGLVEGPSKIAPGATAYVSGPHGTWLGAAGVADTETGAAMRPDARMRLESVSKIYTATLIVQLAEERRLRLDDTVARWLPGLFPDGNRITIRELLTMQSGLIDNNDIRNASATEQREIVARVKDAGLRAKLVAIAARVQKDPASEVAPIWWVRFAAWQPLVSTPGFGYHYSNIGYDVLGLIAARAGGEPLARLYRDRIFEPLGLHATAYDPQGPIEGQHARGYGIQPNGSLIDTTTWHYGVGADGGIVSNATDVARFLRALMRGQLVDRRQVVAMENESLWLGGASSGCAGSAYGWSGGGEGYKTEVWVSDGGERVAVLLLNARHLGTGQPGGDDAAARARATLYCGA